MYGRPVAFAFLILPVKETTMCSKVMMARNNDEYKPTYIFNDIQYGSYGSVII